MVLARGRLLGVDVSPALGAPRPVAGVSTGWSGWNARAGTSRPLCVAAFGCLRSSAAWTRGLRCRVAHSSVANGLRGGPGGAAPRQPARAVW